MTKAIPEMSVDTRAIIKRLTSANPGDTVTYAEISALIGRNIQNGARYVLTSAIKHELADGRVWEAVRKEGVKLLRDNEIVSVGEQAMPRIRRVARKAVRKLTAVQDFSALPNEQKIRHNTLISALGVLAHLTKPKQLTAVEERVRQSSAALPIGKTLEAFK